MRRLHMLVQVKDLVKRLCTDTAIVDVLLFFNIFPLVLSRHGTPATTDTYNLSDLARRHIMISILISYSC